ncbi:unnamed protein product [Adineta ricciae]|uniref:Uncharacterized protein n=1 Tax=Adineta ricciae TaxID=249248 RepID=A0A815C731_ADIRI|nr:unnamed protein product [Adineta ricciae]CAF1279694.1 unnamed protein product [Adineta ricciae]
MSKTSEFNTDEESGKDISKRFRAGCWKPILCGFIVGALCAGIALGALITQYIQDLQKTTTTTTTTTISIATGLKFTFPYFNNIGAYLFLVSLTQSGVQLDFDPNSLPSGWSLCYNNTYADTMDQSSLSTILSSCNKTKLLLGCRQVNTVKLTVAAMGNRADVLYDCSTTENCTQIANGVGWYYSDSYSWGFVNGSDAVERNSCDTGSTNDAYRLCWHTDGGSGGYRCGTTTGLNSDTTWERIIYHAN